jgi:hypothetical protein
MADETLKEALGSAPILSYPHPRETFVCDADASNVGIGRVLSEVQDGQERVIAYYSKALNKAERNYCVTRQQLLLIVRTPEYFHKYLCGHVHRSPCFNREEEERPPLEAAAKQQIVKTVTDWEDLVCPIVTCEVCRLVTA